MHEYSPAKSPPNPRDHYPPTLKICPSLVKVSGTRIIFKCIGLKKLAYKLTTHSIVCVFTPEIPEGGGWNPMNTYIYIYSKFILAL